jgi:predicted dehydrogenase
LRYVLVIGCGSIGRRHALNLKKIGCKVFVCDINFERLKKFSEENSFEYSQDYKEAVDKNTFDAAIIATPSSFHIEPAIYLTNKSINIFMEKPLSTSIKFINELQKLIVDKKITFMMGQSYRFHKGFLMLQDLILNNRIGTIYNVEMFGGWYLPDWHYKEDYREEYAAKSELGGGVLFTSLSHSVDIIRWLFGEIVDFKGWKSKLSDLEIDVEDYVSCTFYTSKKIIVNVIDDFICRLPRSEIRLYGTEGNISTNFSENKINIWEVKNKRFLPEDKRIDLSKKYFKVLEDGILYDNEMEVLNFNFKGNDRYLDEIRFFLKKIENNEVSFSPNYHDGKKVLEILLNDKIKLI